MSLERPTYLPVAEVIAASICWLERFKSGIGPVESRAGYWHKGTCRFCTIPLEELLAMSDLERCDPGQVEQWQRMPRKQRAARIYEAQEDPWWNENR